MILRLANTVVLAIVALYVLEGAGVVEKRRYFPTLPRLEASASDPYAWLGAAQWGFGQLGVFAQNRGGNSFDTGSLSASTRSMLERVSQQNGGNSSGGSGQTYRRYLSRYGS